LHNQYLISVFLGIIEGVTEFLPVSSTAHLRIAEKLFDLPLSEPYWKLYTVVIQLGAVLCLPVYFWRQIVRLVRSFPIGERRDRMILTHPITLVMIAFVITAVPSWLLTKTIGKNLDNFYVIGSALFIGGAVMWAVDVLFSRRGNTIEMIISPSSESSERVLDYHGPQSERGPKTQNMDEMTLFQAIWIGACQILSAVFPGTSRSMSTIAAGQVAGMSRDAAMEFSFFLSIPTMLVATCYALLKALRPEKTITQTGIVAAEIFSPGKMTSQQWLILSIGFAGSFVVAWAVVAWFMAWVRRRGFSPFAFYRLLLGIVVLIWARNAGPPPA